MALSTLPKSSPNTIDCRDVIIFGDDACAKKIADNLAVHGIDTWLVTAGKAPSKGISNRSVNWLADTRLLDCRGFAGDFTISLMQDKTVVRKRAGAIVVAQKEAVAANHETYGLAPHPRILDISALEKMLADDPALFESGSTITFLCGWRVDLHPAVSKRMLDCCCKLQQNPVLSTVFMTGHLKVSATGAQSLYDEAKLGGARFYKFTRTFPEIQQMAQPGLLIKGLDETTGLPLEITTDWVVVDEIPGPGSELSSLAKILEIEVDESGFAQKDNVRRLCNATNRRGIFVAGGARRVMPGDERLADADQVALKVLAYLHDADRDPLPKVEVQRGRCARCLTCLRLCPHKAVDIGHRISIVPQACYGCGICRAGCPARAIDVTGEDIAAVLKEAPTQFKTADIIIFGCARSAGAAHELVRIKGDDLPAGVQFVEVPCGGAVSSRDLLAAFDAGAQGVMLCACHTDNCQSDSGSRLALKRTLSARDILSSAGVEKRRLKVQSLAANMGTELQKWVGEFVAQIRALNAEE